MEKGAKEIAWTWSGKTVEIGVDRLGTGPTLLLLPALSSISTRKEMRPLQMHLASTYETISVDWPGFGDRAKPEVDWRPEAYVAFLDHLVTHIVPQPFATCAAGHAADYVLAQAAAVPGSMGRLCLIAPTWRGPLPTMTGKPKRAFEWIVHAVDRPLLGPSDEQAMGVLGQAAIAHLHEAEHALDHADRVLDLGAHFRLGSVLGPLGLVDNAVLAVAAMGEIPRVRRALPDHFTLAAIGLVAPHARTWSDVSAGDHRHPADHLSIDGQPHETDLLAFANWGDQGAAVNISEPPDKPRSRSLRLATMPQRGRT